MAQHCICLSASLRGAAGPLAAPLSGVIVHRARDTIAGGISLTLEPPPDFLGIPENVCRGLSVDPQSIGINIYSWGATVSH